MKTEEIEGGGNAIKSERRGLCNKEDKNKTGSNQFSKTEQNNLI
jgi:hypothetical protein